MKHQNEHIQIVAAGTAVAHIAVAAAGTSCKRVEGSAVAADCRMVAADILDRGLAATHTGFVAAAIATVVGGMVVAEMLQVEEEAEALEDMERPASVVAVEGSRMVVVTGMGLEELKAQGRPGRAHPGQLQQGARTCS